VDELIYELTSEMLEDGLWRQVAGEIGTLSLYKLAKIVGGSTVYIPKPETLVRPVRDAHIKAEFNGYNHQELAKKYEVTDRWVRLLCGDGFPEGQISLEDIFQKAELRNNS